MRSVIYFILIMGCLVLWEHAVRPGTDLSFFLPRPSAIAERWAEETANGEIMIGMVATGGIVAAGLLAGALGGLAASILLSLFPSEQRPVEIMLLLLGAVPPLALSPLLIMWLGIGLLPKFLLVSFAVTIGSTVSMHDILSTLLRGRCSWLRLMGIGQVKIILHVVLPGAAILLAKVIRQHVPIAILTAFVAEGISSEYGLGHLILRFSGVYDVAGVFACLVQFILLSLAFDRGFFCLEHLMTRENAWGVSRKII